MATVASVEQNTELIQKLSLDSKTNTNGVADTNQKPFESTDGGEATNGSNPQSERCITPVLPDFMDPNVCFVPTNYGPTAYYYGGFDGSINEWEDYPRYISSDGMECPPMGVYGDNGSLMYSYGYPPYGGYAPAGSVPGMGHDGQLYGTQQYQYPASYYQPATPPNGPYASNQSVASKAEVLNTVPSEQEPIKVESANGKTNGIGNGNNSVPFKAHTKSNISTNDSYSKSNGVPPSGYHDPRFGYDGMQWLDGPLFSDGQPRFTTSNFTPSKNSNVNNNPTSRHPNLHPVSPHLMGLHPPRTTPAIGPAHMNGMYPNSRMYGQNGNGIRGGPTFNGFDSRMHCRGWYSVDSKFKPRGRVNVGLYGYGNGNADGLNELNRGPRAGRFKNIKGLTPTITIAVKGQSIPSKVNTEDSDVIPKRDQYNRVDFSTKYSDAKFYVIKSYSEDDIHKSIKYNVWASTSNGNKKLDEGYREAQEKPGNCPVFLFFSVNASGQFVGVAEMVGRVDFNKSLEYWQQDKWTGCFPVKWHIVKDVPNNLLKHITLENNDNKPVTNSRDTQEVKLDLGLELLNIFKDHNSKTSILDDFNFYEARQKTLQEKRTKQQQFQMQVWDCKPTEAVTVAEKDHKGGLNSKARLQQKTIEVSPIVHKEAPQPFFDRNPSDRNSLLSDTQKPIKPVVTVNGISNGC